MRILHVCLAQFYIDDYGYQENILPRMHQAQGHDVKIVASTETYSEKHVLTYTTAGSYLTGDGIPITRIPYAGWLPGPLARKLRVYPGLKDELERFSPDVLFLHDCQFLSVSTIARYAKKHPKVRVYVDGHTDFGNSAKSWLSKHILHKLVYRYCAQLIEPVTLKFYGVLPARVSFFQEIYGISETKTELLVLGADDTKFDLNKRSHIRASIRDRLRLAGEDFLLITGGKIDRRKNIHTLLQAVAALSDANVKVILFGTPDDDMEQEITQLARHPSVRNVGWIAPDDVYDYLLCADLAVFPGTHSVLWEQAVGTGIPCIFRRWDGMDHVDVGGNCEFLETGGECEITEALRRITCDRDKYGQMRRVALAKGVAKFSYSQIARRAIE